MSDRHWERASAAWGLIFVALLLGAFFALPDCDLRVPGFARCVQSNSTAVGIGAFLLGLAVVFFLLFLSSLFSVLRRAEKGDSSLPAVAFMGGTAWAFIYLIGSALLATTAQFTGIHVDPEGTRTVAELGGEFIFGAASGVSFLPLTVLLGASSAPALSSRALPIWLAWAGVGVAVLCLWASGFQLIMPLWLVFPLVMLFLLWVTVTSVVLFLRLGEEPASKSAASA